MDGDKAIDIGIAVAGLIIVPGLTWMIGHYLRVRREAWLAALREQFVTRPEHGSQFQELIDRNERQHKQNVDYLDTIRMEAQGRERRLMTSIRDIKSDTRELTRRVDGLYEKLGDNSNGGN